MTLRRIPDEEWTDQPIDPLALQYDAVARHGWYSNLDRTVEQIAQVLQEGNVLVDYSGGTGILEDRLLGRLPDRSIQVILVDSSPKFLRLALEKFRQDERVGFRLIRYVKEQKRLQFVDEVLEGCSVDAIASTNAIHLYYDLKDTLKSWTRILRPKGRIFIQSGNIRNPSARPGEWIIDETVEALHRAAQEIVKTDPRYADYRTRLQDTRYDALRRKYFLPVRPLDHYVKVLKSAGLKVIEYSTATIQARVDEWYRFLSIYHEGVLGWIGGAEKIEGRPASESAIQDRLALMRQALEHVFKERETFDACWTYLTCRRIKKF